MIDFLFCFNDKYCNHFMGQVLQIVSKTKSRCKFWILTKECDFVTDKLTSLQKMTGLKFDFEVFDFNMYDGEHFDHSVKSHNFISEETFFRLYAINILPRSLRKVIYLDVDVLVKCDMQELWDIDIDDVEIASVEDYWSVIGAHKKKMFTAGFMFMNLDKLREDKFFDKAIEYAKNNDIEQEDFTICNAVIDNVKWLPMEWQFCQYKSWMRGEKPLVESPKMVHFVTAKKPWKVHSAFDMRYFDEYNAFESLAKSLVDVEQYMEQ